MKTKKRIKEKCKGLPGRGNHMQQSREARENGPSGGQQNGQCDMSEKAFEDMVTTKSEDDVGTSPAGSCKVSQRF